MITAATFAILLPSSLVANPKIQAEFERLSKSFDGKAGICAIKDLSAAPICVNGQTPFPMQSVMKLVVSAAVLDLVDAKKMKLSDKITLTAKDFSPGPREFYEKVSQSKGGYSASLEELIRLSIVDSDSMAVDALIKHIGGISVVQDFLKSKSIEGIRIDRDERNLQAEFHGLSWKDAYADPKVWDDTVAKIPKEQKLKALDAYLNDPRDTATPEGMANFLRRLFTTKILSLKSTEKLLLISEQTATGRNRLKAGIPKKWTLGHKTGTSASVADRHPTTNDVGVITSPGGHMLPIAVFLSDSKWSDEKRGELMAKAAKAVTTPLP